MKKNHLKIQSCEAVLILRVCGYHFSRWRGNCRVIMAFILGGIISFLLTEKVVNFSLEHGLTVQILEPFIWVFGDGTSILFVALAMILLFADMPLLDSCVPYFLVRIRVRIWVIGQMLYLIFATCIYTLFILLTTMLFCMRNAFAGNIWSPTAALLGYSEYSDILSIPAELKTFESSYPIHCAAVIFLLMLLYMIISVFVMYALSVYKTPVAGAVSVFAFHLFGFLLNPDFFAVIFGWEDRLIYKANILCGWISPLKHATYPLHDFGYDELPTLQMTYLIFLSGIIILVILVLWKMKRYSFFFSGDFDD